MLFDSHCHLNLAAFDKDREEILKALEKNKVYVINIGTCYETSLKAVEIAQQSDYCWAAVGIHPSHTFPNNFNDKKELSTTESSLAEEFDEKFEQLLKYPKVVAIGECGLDYSYFQNLTSSEKEKYSQKEELIFRQQIHSAQKHNLPLILHIREVYEEALRILKEEHYTGKGVFHFFTGNLEQAQKILQSGFYLGFSGVITYSSKMDEVIKKVPLEKILIETDAPYVAPNPYRGQRNTPFYVQEVAKKIATLKKKSVIEVKSVTLQNTLRLFSLELPKD